MAIQKILGIAWPAFMAACLLELLVFAMVDPQDLHLSGQPLGLSRLAVYTAAFFVFWAISMVASGLTALLCMPSAEVNRGPLPPGDRSAGQPQK